MLWRCSAAVDVAVVDSVGWPKNEICSAVLPKIDLLVVDRLIEVEIQIRWQGSQPGIRVWLLLQEGQFLASTGNALVFQLKLVRHRLVDNVPQILDGS